MVLVRDLLVQIADLEADIDALELEIADLRAQIALLTPGDPLIADLEAEILDLEAEIADLELQLEAALLAGAGDGGDGGAGGDGAAGGDGGAGGAGTGGDGGAGAAGGAGGDASVDQSVVFGDQVFQIEQIQNCLLGNEITEITEKITRDRVDVVDDGGKVDVVDDEVVIVDDNGKVAGERVGGERTVDVILETIPGKNLPNTGGSPIVWAGIVALVALYAALLTWRLRRRGW